MMDFDRNSKLEYIKKQIPESHFNLIEENEIDGLFEYLTKIPVTAVQSKDIYFMRLAREISTWSKDPSTKIGSIAISKDNFILLSQGYNGFPRGIKDDHRLYIRALKYPMVVHAEMNMIYNAAHNGTSLNQSTVYIFGLPCCGLCSNALIQAGVSRVVMTDTKNDPLWNSSFKETEEKFKEANIQYSFIDVEEL